MTELWKVQVKGERGDKAWEITVVREDNHHGQKSWGWIDDKKLLVSHNGGPCRDAICGFVWDEQIKLAKALCERLNNKENVWE